MSYLGYAKMMADYCASVYSDKKEPVKILEIGVSVGQTALPLLSNLTTLGIEFLFVGVDVLEEDTFFTQISFMEGVRPALVTDEGTISKYQSPNYFYVIENSLKYLPKLVQDGTKFDCILLDGDHNYATVSAELGYFNDITAHHAVCFADDYNGKHSGEDAFHVDNKEHQHIKHMFTDLKNDKNKQGVNTAINDFIQKNSEWGIYDPMPQFEPVILHKNMIVDKVDEVNHTLIPVRS